jgi:hypothetical protein
MEKLVEVHLNDLFCVGFGKKSVKFRKNSVLFASIFPGFIFWRENFVCGEANGRVRPHCGCLNERTTNERMQYKKFQGIWIIIFLCIRINWNESWIIKSFAIHSHQNSIKYQRSFRFNALPKAFLKEQISFYNSLTKTQEKFSSISENKVLFYRYVLIASLFLSYSRYSCGPTVYDFAHIGNFRAFLTYDLIKRWLLYCGYNVDHICNLTDVDDKIIVKMKKENESLHGITEKYINHFLDDIEV